MELREGYKNTEVGVIPEDWELKEFGDFLKVIGGGAFKSRDSSQTGVKWLKIANVDINKTNWDDESFLPIELIKDNENFLLKEGDYVLALTRPILDRKLKIAKLNLQDVPALLNQRVGKIEVESQTNIDYTYYLFQKFETISGLLQSMAGTDPPNLSNKGIYGIKCGVPPTKSEQTAIATALSDADALINSLSTLIAKKRNIKQGAMQQLLKPKEGWEVKKLGEICDIKKGEQLNRSTLNENDHYPVFNGGVLPSGYTGEWNQNENTIIISEGGNSCGFVNFIKTKFWQGGHCYSLNTKLDKEYFYQMLKAREKEIMALRVGSGLPNIQRNRLFDFLIIMPGEEEQNEIATILSDMDAEIQALESKLEKYRKIKLGMMQNLLTGKIRLV